MWEGLRILIISKIQAAARLKELEIPIADEFIVHQVLTQLSSLFNQLKTNYTTQKAK